MTLLGDGSLLRINDNDFGDLGRARPDHHARHWYCSALMSVGEPRSRISAMRPRPGDGMAGHASLSRRSMACACAAKSVVAWAATA